MNLETYADCFKWSSTGNGNHLRCRLHIRHRKRRPLLLFGRIRKHVYWRTSRKETQEVRLPDEDFTPVKVFVYWILNESKSEKKGTTDLGLSESEKTGIAEIIKLWRFGDERQCAAGFENAVLQALIDRAKRHPDRIEPTHILMAANVTTPGSSLWNLIIDLYVWQWQSPCLENFKDMQTPGKYPEHFLADVVEGYVRKFAPRMPCYHDRAPFNAGPAQYMNRARQHHGRGRI